MADQQYGAFCQFCQQQRLFTKQGTNHVLHLILTVVTFGFWGIVWLIIAVSNSAKKPRCSACGTELGAVNLTGAAPAVPQQALTSAPPAAHPPGWHADPGQGVPRWWDGTKWTDHVAPEGTSPPPPSPARPSPPSAPEPDEAAPEPSDESSESDKTSPSKR